MAFVFTWAVDYAGTSWQFAQKIKMFSDSEKFDNKIFSITYPQIYSNFENIIYINISFEGL